MKHEKIKDSPRRVFRAKEGLEDEDAGIVADFLNEALRGERSCEIVVNSARDESSPLYPLFEWDDSICAEKYRKEQARAVMKNIVLEEMSAEDVLSQGGRYAEEEES